MTDCGTCKYIKKGVFPFINFEGDGFYIDTEGCTTEDHLKINYCPRCGKKLENKDS